MCDNTTITTCNCATLATGEPACYDDSSLVPFPCTALPCGDFVGPDHKCFVDFACGGEFCAINCPDRIGPTGQAELPVESGIVKLARDLLKAPKPVMFRNGVADGRSNAPPLADGVTIDREVPDTGAAIIGSLIFDGGAPGGGNFSGNEMTNWTQAEDFVLAADTNLTSVRFWTLEGVPGWDGTCTYAIHGDAGGVPGGVLDSGSVALTRTNLGPASGLTWYENDFDLPAPLNLTAGTTYWLALHMSADCVTRDEVFWDGTGAGFGLTGVEDFECTGGPWPANPTQHAFQLYGVDKGGELNWDGWFVSFHLPEFESIKLPDAYQIDDGFHENSIGLTGGGDIIWLNQFNVVAGMETINSISLAWGPVAAGTPTTVMLYDDPNNDGDPSDAVLLTTANTTVSNPDLAIFATVDITDTFVGNVGESFFVGAFATHLDLEWPAALDQTSSLGRSWVAGDGPGTGDIVNLLNNSLLPVVVDSVGFPGNWLLRGGAAFVPTGQAEPLALYYCDADVVDMTPTGIPACDAHPVEEYEVDLDACCLIHANVDPRTGSVPAAKDAFYEEKCLDYLIDIEATVGREYVQDPVTLECIEVDTGKDLDGPFWGWHTTDVENGINPAVQTTVKMGPEGEWLFGPWVPVATTCSVPNMAFELLTNILGGSEDCNNNWIPDQCELDCQPNGVPDDCDIANGTSPDVNGNGVPDECECCASTEPQPILIPDSVGGNPLKVLTANRTLIFRAGDDCGDQGQAIRVTYRDLAPPFHVWNGQQLWVGEPKLVTENGSQVSPLAGSENSVWAKLQCTPYCRNDWASLGDLHVFQEGIVHSSLYEIQVVDCKCTDKEEVYSSPLTLETSNFADIVRDCTKIPCSPPEGGLITVLDFQAVVNAFTSSPGAVRKARADLEPNCLDLVINVSDWVEAVSGFNGLFYRFLPKDDMTPCPKECPNPIQLEPSIP